MIGVGVVTGPYRYDAGREYPHSVPVSWRWRGDYEIEDKRSLAIRTLVESSRRNLLLAELDRATGGGADKDGGAAVLGGESGAARRDPYTLAIAAADLFVGERWLEHQLRSP